MPKGNSAAVQKELAHKLRDARRMIDESLALLAGSRNVSKEPARSSTRLRIDSGVIQFDMNERAFVKRYAKNLTGGPKKFVLVLAYLAKGDTNKNVSLNEVQALWNRMRSKTLLGMNFNTFFSTTAKEQGWVDTQKRGTYNLARSWKEIFSS